jgi:hypothetical protein
VQSNDAVAGHQRARIRASTRLWGRVLPCDQQLAGGGDHHKTAWREVRADDQQGTVAVQVDTERIDGRAICEELSGLGFGPCTVVGWEDKQDGISDRGPL